MRAVMKLINVEAIIILAQKEISPQFSVLFASSSIWIII
jgi:hypothetical protein